MNTDSVELTLAITSVPDEETAKRFADILLEERLAACISILPGAQSHYMWKGKKETNAEVLLLIKTLTSKIGDMETRIRAVHPYECPEIVCISAHHVHAPYLQWVSESVK